MNLSLGIADGQVMIIRTDINSTDECKPGRNGFDVFSCTVINDINAFISIDNYYFSFLVKGHNFFDDSSVSILINFDSACIGHVPLQKFTSVVIKEDILFWKKIKGGDRFSCAFRPAEFNACFGKINVIDLILILEGYFAVFRQGNTFG